MAENIRKVVKYQGRDFDLSQGQLTSFQIYYLNLKGILSTPEAMVASSATIAKASGKCPMAAWRRSYHAMSDILSSFESSNQENLMEEKNT